MKNFKFILLAIVAILTFSCSSSDSSGSDSTYIRFKVNGGNQINLVDPATITSLMTSISASEDLGSDIRSIFFTIPVDVTTGAHAITDASGSDLTAYSVDYSLGNVYVTGTSGTFTITSIGSEYMEGTFSFTGVDSGTGATYTITEGSFRAYKPTPAG
jgi:hypothetical protein